MKFTQAKSLLLYLMSIGLILSQTISGTVVDASSGEVLAGANIVVKGSLKGASADADGKFSISVSGDVTLVISYIGYKSTEFSADAGSDEVYRLKEEVYGQQVVVTASRKSESLLEAPVTIEVLDAIAIKNAPKANFYEAIGQLKAIDLTTSSMAMPVINMRGFNSTSPDRFVQYMDGMDNQAPALNFPVGNMVGMSELDIEAVEVVYGAASALYGPNAFNGVVSMKSKSPWDYQGLSARIKSGSRSLFDGAFRFAKAIDNKFAYKVNFSYMQADDWVADNDINNYGALGTVSTNIGDVIDDVIAGAAAVYGTSSAEYLGLAGMKAYMAGFGYTYGNMVNTITNAYKEENLVDYDTKNLKVNTSLHYRLNDNLELSYTFNYGQGTGVYQGANRYSLKNLSMQQHKIQLDKKGEKTNWTFKAYQIVDDAGDSYDAVFTGVNLTKSALSPYYGNIVGGLAGQLAAASSNFTVGVGQAVIDGTLAAVIAGVDANSATALSFLKPGTAAFDAEFEKITGNANLSGGGSKFVDNSSISHIEYQLDTKLGDMDMIAGASFRQYNPESDGTIFRDGSWQAIAGDNVSKSLGDIKTTEYGVFTQFQKAFMNERLKLTASARYDKHENFDGQFSPRVSFVYSFKSDEFEANNGNLRASYQTAFRNPSLQDQFIGLDVIQAVLWGNIDGFTRGYDIASVLGGSPKPVTVAAVTPEKVSTWEVGYKTIINERWFMDMNYYRSNYTNFIQAKNVLVPDGDNPLNFATGAYRVYQVDSNSDGDVTAEGFSFSTNYNLSSILSVNANYAYALLYDDGDKDAIPAFNTPKNKWNLGLTGRNIGGHFGFNANLKHVDGFDWEGSTAFTGRIPAYQLLDIALLYDFEMSKQPISLKLAMSNILNNEHFEAYGAPTVGSLVVFQISTEF